MPEAASATVTFLKLINDLELHLLYGHKNHLRNAIARINYVGLLRPVPDRYINLPLVIGVNQASQIPQHDAVLVTQT